MTKSSEPSESSCCASQPRQPVGGPWAWAAGAVLAGAHVAEPGCESRSALSAAVSSGGDSGACAERVAHVPAEELQSPAGRYVRLVRGRNGFVERRRARAETGARAWGGCRPAESKHSSSTEARSRSSQRAPRKSRTVPTSEQGESNS
eukprot:2908202-Pleurochrysis_carterae.AAC.1